MYDLQILLMCMCLWLEKVIDVLLQQKFIDDLGVMYGMVWEGLDLVCSMDFFEKIQVLDIDLLFDSVCVDVVDVGQDVVL